MKNITLIILTIAVLANAGCGKTHCPAFPPHLVDYYPYHVGDILRFANSKNDTIAVKISNVDTSGKESYAWNCGCSCGISHSFATEIDPLLIGQMFMTGGMYGDEDDIRIACCVSDTQSSGNFSLWKENINPRDPKNIQLFGDTLIRVCP